MALSTTWQEKYAFLHFLSGDVHMFLAWCLIGRLHFLTWPKSSRLDLCQVSSFRSKYLLRPEFN